ncbi:adhesion G protein-coupled receptor A3 isoform X3 [Hydra vulgaris]|uniref:Adhesion G protein-coupled receptor A3 isoform X3 n=1 Tax=Hydra vulgaris TaxID=6087 RepID=A0ABM4BHE5_HYDVU
MFSIFFLLTIIYGVITDIDECPSVPLGCRCNHKKKGFSILCKNLKFVSLAALPTNISMDIDLEGSYLQFLNESSFPHPNKIKKLILRNCGIEVLGARTFHGFLALKILDLSKNRITQISESVFQGLEKSELLNIDLKYNYILSISQRAFEKVSSDVLDLSGQRNYGGKRAELIAYNDFLTLSKIKKLSLDDNQLLCDCNIKWIGNWLSKDRQLSEETSCYYPEQLRGKSLKNLLNSSWNCGEHQQSFFVPNFQLIPSKNQIGFENDAMQFTCFSTWVMKSYMMWIKNGKELFTDKLKRIEIRHHSNLTLAVHSSVLLIHRLNLIDTGAIVCQLLVHGSGNVTSTINLSVISKNSPNCKPSVTKSDQGHIMWPTAYFNTAIKAKCPYGGVSLAERTCGNGTWNNFSMENCFFGNPITRALQLFHMNVKAAESDDGKTIVDIVHNFNTFLHEKYNFIKSKFDFYYITRIIFYIMKFSRSLDKSQYTNFIWGSIGLIIMKHKELHSLEEKVNNYSAILRFQQLLETFLYEESSKKSWSFSIENHPILAALSYQVNTEKLVQCYVIGSNVPEIKGKSNKIICAIEKNNSMEKNAVVSISFAMKTVQLSIITFTDNTFFPCHGNHKMTSPVVGIQIFNVKDQSSLIDTNKHYQTISFHKVIGYAKSNIVLWDRDMSEWKPATSCSSLNDMSVNSFHYKCSFGNLEKMNYFALLAEIPASTMIKFQYMEIVIYFGAVLSTVFLLFTFVLYSALRELRFNRGDAAAIMNLMLSLIIGQLTFFCGIHRTDIEFLCKGVAFILHYFLLSSLLWLGCGSVMLMKLLTRKKKSRMSKVIGKIEQHDPVLKYYIISWGVPLIICSVTIAYDHKKYKTDRLCWLAPNISIGAFVCPAVFFLLGDLFILCYLHAVINKLYPVLNEPVKENPSVTRYKNKVENHTHTKPSILEYEFPNRNELISLLHGNLLLLLFFCLLIVFTKMIFIYKDTTSGYLYYIFSYASAISNVILGLVTVCFYCLPRGDMRNRIKKILRCFHWKKEELTIHTCPNLGESLENNDKSNELLDAGSESHGVFGLSDIVSSESSYPIVCAAVADHCSNIEMDSKRAFNQVNQRLNPTPSEVSGHTSIGECSLNSRPCQKNTNNPKSSDIPENLRNFVPENWRPVRRRVKKGTLFYPYVNTDNSIKSPPMVHASMNHGLTVHGSNTSSVTSTNIGITSLNINKKQAAKNLAMYNDLFNKPKLAYEPYFSSNGSTNQPITQNAFYNNYNDFNRNIDDRLYGPNLLSPTFFPIQYNNTESVNQIPMNFLNSNQATNNYRSMLVCENNFSEHSSSERDNTKDHKLATVHEINDTVNNKSLEDTLLKKAPILYIPLPHITKKQFELCAETQC